MAFVIEHKAKYNRPVVLVPGTTTRQPLAFRSGPLNTTAVAGAMEYDATGFFGTVDTVSGRGFFGPSQFFMLAADGAAIGSSIEDVMGANSAISLKAASIYFIEWEVWFLKTTSGTLTWTITNTQAPVNMNAEWFGAAGGIASAGTPQRGGRLNSTTASHALPATASIADTVNTKFNITALIETHATLGSDIRLQITCSAGTITPQQGSFMRLVRIPSASIGTYVA